MLLVLALPGPTLLAAAPRSTAPATDAAPNPVQPDPARIAADLRQDEQRDARITASIAARLLRQPSLRGVTVDVASGIATLGGEVLGDGDRARAIALAKQVEGVTEVVDSIAITANLRIRVSAALGQLQDKLVRLVAAIPLLLAAFSIVLVAWWLGRRIARRPLRWLPSHSHNPYMDGLLRRVAQAIVVVIGLVLALNLMGATALVGAVLGSAGVIGLVLGFAFKDVVENYIAGVLLSLRRPFAPDDHLVIDKYEGKVIALTARATLLMTLDGNQLSLPNGLVFRSVVLNYTINPKRRFDFALPIDPGESISRARDLGLAAIQQVEGVLDDPAPSWSTDGYFLKGIDLRYFGWVDQQSNDVGKVRSEALRAVRGAYAEAGIHGPEAVRYRLPTAKAHEETGGDTSVNRDIDAQLAAAQRASDDDLLTPKPSPP
ncbi:MAG: mechanosensitive ion channel family protein [Luteimonas sp.]